MPIELTRTRVEIVFIPLSVILITLFHFASMQAASVLLHEVSQRLYYLPIIFAAYRFGLKGSVLCSVFAAGLYLSHISGHRHESEKIVVNQLVEAVMFQVVGIATGLLSNAERRQVAKLEQASLDLSRAYRELRETVNLLLHTARLNSLGEMAASVAHEIRNPLAAIKGAFEIVAEAVPADNPRREFVTVVETELERLNTLVSDFLKFSRPRTPEKKPVSINTLISTVLMFASPQAQKRSVVFVTDLVEPLPHLLVDDEQMKQVLLNLVLNAIQAQPQGGTVEVKTRTLPEMIEISIRDYGSGVPPQARDSIFEPFVTTKPDGTGLGLAIAYQLVKQHGGDLKLVNISGPGSEFVVSLPIQ